MSWAGLVVAFIGIFLVIPAWWRMRKEEAHAAALRKKAVAEGSHEPMSIRPWVDPSKCMGSGACVKACPEKDVLKVINGQATLVNGSHCVGHGACVAACPVSAISLVFGSERRGVDLPSVAPDFQSNVAGLYVAGELGGMGLIANAVRQGVEAMGYLAAGLPRDRGDRLDVVIVGAGPAGFGAGLAAVQKGLRYALVEQEEFGGAIAHYPRQKIVMTRSMDLPGYGMVWLRTARKEELVTLFGEVLDRTGLRIDARERVDEVTRDGDGFVVTTSKRRLRTWRVVLAVGRRGTPRRLGVPGEDHEKVSYRLVDPELYRHQHLLVVGGGDSAIEAACALSEQPGNRVTLSYRGAAFSRLKDDNRDRLGQAVQAGAMRLLLESNVRAIETDRVVLDQLGEEVVVPNDYVFVFAGGVLPTEFLAKAGLTVQTHYGRRVEPRTSSTP